MHPWTDEPCSNTTQASNHTSTQEAEISPAHNMTQDVKGNVYVHLTWTASSRKEECVDAYGITNGGEHSVMGSSKARG